MGSGFRKTGQATMYRVNWKKREGVPEVGRYPGSCTPRSGVVMTSAVDTGRSHVTLSSKLGQGFLQIAVSRPDCPAGCGRGRNAGVPQATATPEDFGRSCPGPVGGKEDHTSVY